MQKNKSPCYQIQKCGVTLQWCTRLQNTRVTCFKNGDKVLIQLCGEISFNLCYLAIGPASFRIQFGQVCEHICKSELLLIFSLFKRFAWMSACQGNEPYGNAVNRVVIYSVEDEVMSDGSGFINHKHLDRCWVSDWVGDIVCIYVYIVASRNNFKLQWNAKKRKWRDTRSVLFPE